MRKAGALLVKTSLYLILTGIILTSPVLIKLAIIPAILLIIPSGMRVKIVRESWDEKISVGENLSVSILVDLKGMGIVRIRHTLPEYFELVYGSNFKEVFVLGRRLVKINYKAKATKRGIYSLNKLEYELENFSQTFVKRGIVRSSVLVEVKHKLPKIKKVREIRGKAKSPIPGIDIAKIGVPGTDFREIREYMPGDSIKFVNWKATARRGKMMVNQYEVEGKKAVWIFLDSNPYMLHGTTVKNYLESAVEAANGLAYYYTTRGHKVGLYVVGDARMIHPDVGSRQFKRISKSLLEVEGGRENIEDALEKCKKMILLYKPLLIIITRAERMRIEKILKLSKLIPIQVIALKGLDHGFSGAIMDVARRKSVSKLRACCNCVEFDVNKPLAVW
ncbi:MAG: hypothetical protein DSY33_03850 [Archaeoglobus sp.]|jgi:uncharacterized protein (DUF58 family)|nr:MAG: hypothetical protein DSY33_03850 [Archaeoglobus sp.]